MSLVICIALAAAFPSPAGGVKPKGADVENKLEPLPTIESARERYENAYFGESILILDKLLHGTHTEAIVRQAKTLLALNFLAIGNEARARLAFQDLLDLDPDFRLPEMTTPTVRKFFADVKKSYRIVPTITHEPPLRIDAIAGARLEVNLERMRPDYAPKVMYRTEGQPFFSRADLTPTSTAKVSKTGAKVGKYHALIPPALLLRQKGYALEYFFVVADDTDTPLTQLRDPRAPYSVPVNVPVNMEASTPVYKRWWLWTLVGAAVAGGAVATALILTRPNATNIPPAGGADVTLHVRSGR